MNGITFFSTSNYLFLTQESAKFQKDSSSEKKSLISEFFSNSIVSVYLLVSSISYLVWFSTRICKGHPMLHKTERVEPLAVILLYRRGRYIELLCRKTIVTTGKINFMCHATNIKKIPYVKHNISECEVHLDR